MSSADSKMKSQNSTRKLSPDAKEPTTQLNVNSPISPIKKRQKARQDMVMNAELEKKLYYFQEMVENLEIKLDTLKKQIDIKITAEDVRKLTSDKISKEDLEHMIPSEEIT